MLMAAALPLPRMVWAHGYVQWEGAKVSKSSGVVVSVDRAIARYGPDPLRWFLLREVGFLGDGNFTWERFDERYHSDLADGLGNLAARSLAMLAKYRENRIPAGGRTTTLDEAGVEAAGAYADAMDRFDVRTGAEAIGELVSQANQYIVQRAPWTLARNHLDAELDEALGALGRCLYRLAVLAGPFMPEKAELLWQALGRRDSVTSASWESVLQPSQQGDVITRSPILFPKPEPAK
jgi:methionyl-tRNA synthetase